MTKLSESN